MGVGFKTGTCPACAAEIDGGGQWGQLAGHDWQLDPEGRPALIHWARELERRDVEEWLATEYLALCSLRFVVTLRR